MAEPVLLAEVDLRPDGRPVLSGLPPQARAYAAAAVAVRVHGELVGEARLRLDRSGWSDGEVAERALDAVRGAVDAHLRRDGLRPGETGRALPRCRADHETYLRRAPTATVVVASRDGEATLGSCLDSLLAQEHPRFEVLVVDSASRGDEVCRVVDERAGGGVPLRYVHEARPGVAVAHNRGLAETTATLVAFADDDVVADPAWLARLGRAFELAPGVACVTGQILPLELESPAQLWVDGWWGFGKGYERRVFDARQPAGERLYPYTAGVFGSGANMAFRTEVLRDMGGFDPHLGTGSVGRGGDDLAAFFDVIAAGHRLVYEPTAVVRHRHRADYASLRRQAYGYGAGLTAYLAKVLADEPRRMWWLGARAPRAAAHLLSSSSPKNARRPHDLPAELKGLELRGMTVGAPAYLRGRRRAARRSSTTWESR